MVNVIIVGMIVLLIAFFTNVECASTLGTNESVAIIGNNSLIGQINLGSKPGGEQNSKPSSQMGALDSEAFIVYAAGDICDDESNDCNKTAAIISTDNQTDYVIALGDLAYERGTISEFERHYHPYWGPFKEKTLPVVGNHEKDDGSGYFEYFGDYFGSPGNRHTPPGDKREGFYSLDLGDSWHLVGINTYRWKTAQKEWLRRDLRQNNRNCTLVFGHNPRYSPGKYGPHGSSGVPDRMKEIFELLVEEGVDVYLAGHDHIYSHFRKQDNGGASKHNGTAQFVVGTGGKNVQPIAKADMTNLLSSWTCAKPPCGDGPFGVLRLVLQQGWYEFSFHPTDGAVFDIGSETCSGRSVKSIRI